jgi:hypothetical protein
VPAWIEPAAGDAGESYPADAGQARSLSECGGSAKGMADLVDDFAGKAEQVASTGIYGRRAARRAM